jgi:hypothetical protein
MSEKMLQGFILTIALVLFLLSFVCEIIRANRVAILDYVVGVIREPVSAFRR